MERQAKMEETVFQVSGPLRLETYLLHFIIMHIISKLQEMYFELSLRWIQPRNISFKFSSYEDVSLIEKLIAQRSYIPSVGKTSCNKR